MNKLRYGSCLVVFLVAMPALAQDQAAAARTAAGCGADNVSFDVKVDKKQHPAPVAEAGKARLYVFEELKTDDTAILIGGVTTKVGLDGNWLGGNKDGGYVFFSVNPGDHRVCAAWQSSIEGLARLASAASFTAQPGDVFYFRIKVRAFSPRGGRGDYDLNLEPVDPAEAQLLIANLAPASSHPKK
jgi:hypothetical protein